MPKGPEVRKTASLWTLEGPSRLLQCSQPLGSKDRIKHHASWGRGGKVLTAGISSGWLLTSDEALWGQTRDCLKAAQTAQPLIGKRD